MTFCIRRREFIAALGGAAGWPLGARAQQRGMPVVGFLHPGAPEPNGNLVAAFRQGLAEAGFVEGRNVKLEFRWARNNNAQLAEFAAELVRLGTTVLFAWGGIGGLAAKAATTTIPVVFSTGGDAVQIGLVANLNRPGGNVTGIASMDVELAGKRLGLLKELVRDVQRIAVLINPDIPDFGPAQAEVTAGARTIGRGIEFFEARSLGAIDAAFEGIAQKRADALLVVPSAFFANRRMQIVSLAARHSLPAVYPEREFSEAGGLMSYGPSSTDQIRQAGFYTGRILKGEKPGDLPVIRPVKFELVINRQTAKTLRLEMPATLLTVADELIE
jgi:putative tryptophan/tyrosine transport system substrate-binding protein